MLDIYLYVFPMIFAFIWLFVLIFVFIVLPNRYIKGHKRNKQMKLEEEIKRAELKALYKKIEDSDRIREYNLKKLELLQNYKKMELLQNYKKIYESDKNREYNLKKMELLQKYKKTEKEVIECKHCGAMIFGEKGDIVQCEYCGNKSKI